MSNSSGNRSVSVDYPSPQPSPAGRGSKNKKVGRIGLTLQFFQHSNFTIYKCDKKLALVIAIAK